MDELLLICSNNAGKIKLTAASGNADSESTKAPGQIRNPGRGRWLQAPAILAAASSQWQKQGQLDGNTF